MVRVRFKALSVILVMFVSIIQTEAKFKKIVIHVPMKVKHHQHTHTVYKHVHHTVPVHHDDIHVVHDHHNHHYHNEYNDGNYEVLGSPYSGVGAGVVDITSYGKQSYDNLMNQNRNEKPNEYGPPPPSNTHYKKRTKRKQKSTTSRSKRNEFKGVDQVNYSVHPTASSYNFKGFKDKDHFRPSEEYF